MQNIWDKKKNWFSREKGSLERVEKSLTVVYYKNPEKLSLKKLPHKSFLLMFKLDVYQIVNLKGTEGMSLQWRQKPGPYNHKNCLGNPVESLHVPGSKYPWYCCIKGIKVWQNINNAAGCQKLEAGLKFSQFRLWGWSSSVRTFRGTAVQTVEFPVQECGADCIQQGFAWSRFMNNVIYWSNRKAGSRLPW